MDWPDDLLAGLPSPRDDEPASLRRDIEDELADHLHCAMQRERTATDDEQTARRAVLARFGNPRRVACKLWFDAMKGKIMKDRLMIAASILMMLTCAAAIGAMWLTLKESREVNAALLAQLKTMSTQSGQAAIPADAAFIKIKAVQGTPGGKPVTGLRFSLKGNPFDPAKEQEVELVTDKDGIATAGPIRPGQYGLYCDAAWQHSDPVTLFGGQTLEKTIACPPDVNVQPVSAKIQVDWSPEILKWFDVPHLSPNEIFLLGGELQSDPSIMKLAGTNWYRGPLSFVANREGLFDCVNVGLGDNGRFPLRSKDRLQATAPLVPGRYRLKSLFIYTGAIQSSLDPNFFYQFKKDEEPVIELGTDGILKIIPPPAFLKALQDVYGLEKTITLQKGETQQFRDLQISLQECQAEYAGLLLSFRSSNSAELHRLQAGYGEPIKNIELKVERIDKEAGDRGRVTLHLRYIPAGTPQSDPANGALPLPQPPSNSTSSALSRSSIPPQALDPALTALVHGRIQKALPIRKDCMILKYIPEWAHGEVDNIAFANNDGGVRLLLDWPAIPADDALTSGRQFLLALYSRKTTDCFKDDKAARGAILASEITTDWPEATSWKTQPPIAKKPAAAFDFTPGDGWKLFDVTPIVHARVRDKKTGHGLMLHFADESRSGNKHDWSGYECVSREGAQWQGKDYTHYHPVLLVVDSKSQKQAANR